MTSSPATSTEVVRFETSLGVPHTASAVAASLVFGRDAAFFTTSSVNEQVYV
jgi:hypothetical protein